jgi:putative transposase
MPVRLGPMTDGSLKAQTSGGRAADFVNALSRLRITTACKGTTRSTNICWQRADSLIKLANMKIYRGFPERLHHRVPHWVEPCALFHVRIALDREKEQQALTHPALAQAILDPARFYETKRRWNITLFLLMPDHLHAILSFARDQSMSDVIRDWKRFHARTNHALWQEGYFDHRLRPDEGGAQLSAKMSYIRPRKLSGLVYARRLRTGLGSSIHSPAKVDRLLRRRWQMDRRRRKYQAAEPQWLHPTR